MTISSRLFLAAVAAACLTGPASADLPGAASAQANSDLGPLAPPPQALALRCVVHDNPGAQPHDIVVLPTVASIPGGTALTWQVAGLEGNTTLPAVELGQWHVVASILPQVAAAGTRCRAILG